MKVIKGFNQDMTCRGYQYEVGKTHEFPEAKLCESGAHAVECPLDVFDYYSPSNSVYHECELEDVSPERHSGDTKVSGKRIKIGARLSIRDLVKAQIEYVKEHTTTEYTDPERATAGYRGAATAGDDGVATAGDHGAATAGDCGMATAGRRGAATAGDCGVATAGYRGAATAGNSGAATAGYRGAATAGYHGAATAGDDGVATAGDHGAATAGDCGMATAGDDGVATAGDHGVATAGDHGVATAGYRGAATAGDCGVATAGYRGAATAGYHGAATSRGKTRVGENGVGLARGNNVQVCGGMGAILMIAEESKADNEIIGWKCAVVDGVALKPEVWYKLVDGEFVEA